MSEKHEFAGIQCGRGTYSIATAAAAAAAAAGV